MWLHIITIILLVAKLAGYFAYSWWWVVAPSLLSFGVATFLLIIMVVGFIAAAIWGEK